jgi:serine/threonine protein kinase/tetratricopeptide (TPR) repeat protein
VNERTIFMEALGKEAPGDRAAYLDAACSGDPALRARVEALLGSHEDAGEFLNKPVPERLAGAAPDDTRTGPATLDPDGPTADGGRAGPAGGAVIGGRYKLIEQIGEGGMGTVWLAQQTEPVKRPVAVKLIKPGMDSKQVLARFEAERQALALMDHPHIAKVHDAGTTPDGRPFFVMELVKGVPITRYCDDHRLTTRQRLDLFLPVCHAIQHAHQKGVIHRDLKPSNVLVAPYDGRPVPKVIDFGVAKAAGQPLTDKTLMTGLGAVVGTPEYMSPEQAELNNQDIDTRSDVYALGVLLYELLTGGPPFTKMELERAGMLEMLRVIREQEPSKPSTKLSSSDALPTLSANRGTEPAKLTRLVRGELDWIVMKALEKDRGRRYDTANGFAMDVQRYLADEPVQACPPSATYRLGKLVRRNKVALTTAGLISAALVTAVVVLAVSNVRIARETREKEAALEKATASESHARTQARRATIVADLLQQALESANPDALKGAGFTVRELLDAFSDGLDDQIRGQPEVEATIRRTIGRAYWRLGDLDAADRHLARVLELRRSEAATEPTALAQALVDWAWVMKNKQKFELARTALQEALGIYRNSAGPSHELEVLKPLIIAERRQGHLGEVDRIGGQAREWAQSHSIRDDPDLATILSVWSRSRLLQGKAAEAEILAREGVAMLRRTRPKDHPNLAYSLSDLAKALAAQGKYEDAEAQDKEALKILRKRYYDEDCQGLVRELVGLLRAQKKDHEADALEEEARQGLLEQLNKSPHDLKNWLAFAEGLRSAKLWVLALPAYQAAANLAGSADTEQRLRICNGLRGVARDLQDQGKLSECLPAYQQSATVLEKIIGEDVAKTRLNEMRDNLASVYAYLGLALWDLHQLEEAVNAERKAIDLWRQLGEADPKREWYPHEEAYFSSKLAEWLQSMGRSQDALEYARAAVQLLEQLADRLPEHKDEYAERLVGARDKWLKVLKSLGRVDEAVATGRKACELNPGNPACFRRLAQTEAKLGRWADAAGDFSRAIELDGCDWESWNGRGVAHLFLNQPAKAVDDLTTCLGLHADNASVWRTRAGAYSRLGRWDLAAADYSRALEINPKSADDQNDLARLLAMCPDAKVRNPRRAIDLASRAVDLAPKRGSFWNTLGVARYYAGDHKRAIDALNKSMELGKGGNSFDWYFLAMAQHRLGNGGGALDWYRKAVAWHERNKPKDGELARFRAEAEAVLGLMN